MDEDTINEVTAENKVYQSWVREKKNHILKIVDSVRKQREWNDLFPQVQSDDSYLAGNLF